MDPQQPATPTRNHPPVIEQSTPATRGSTSNAQSDVKSNQSDYAPFLEEDVANERRIPLEMFLQEILHVSPEGKERMQNLAATNGFQTKLDAYKQEVGRETDLYEPFVELANFCLDKFGMNHLQFCRNDPTIIRGSKSSRKPDVVNVEREALGKKGRGGVTPKHMHEAGPGREGAFHWPELRSFWEFKVKDDTVDTSTPTVEAPATNPAKANSKQRAEPKAPTRESLPRSGKAISNPEAVSAGNKRPSEDPGSLGLPPKRSRTENVDPKIQCASYALELLSNGGLRSHVIAVLVSRNSLEMLYYDRSLVLKSQPLDFTEDTTSFLAILFSFGNLTPTQWGDPASTLLKAPTVATFSDDYKAMYFGYVLTLSEGWQLQLGNVIFRAHGIIGRGTVVVGAKVVASPLPNFVGKHVVVKWSWVATTRKEEGYIVKKAVECADANRPSMRHHLPNIYHYQELPEQTPQCQKFMLANFKDAYEERILRIVVQEELHPITDLTDATELAEAFKQIFECYRWLYEGPKIMHRDVSISNLMFQRIDGKLYGVLNDFDLAAFHDGT